MIQLPTKLPSPAKFALLISAIALGSACVNAANQLIIKDNYSDAPAETASSRPAATAERKKIDYGQLVDFHLFGEAAQQPLERPEKEQLIKAPETRLKLQLVGVVFDRDTDDGLAIISEPGKPQKTYRKGEKIPGDATLVAVERERIILERNGRPETLSLKKIDLDSEGASSGRDSSTAFRPQEAAPTPPPSFRRRTKVM